MGEYSSVDGGGGAALLGYGSLEGPSADVDPVDRAIRAASATASWLRLYLTMPQPWRAHPLVQAAGLKRASDDTFAWEFRTDGTGLGDRKQVLKGLLATQLRSGQAAIWQLYQLQGIPSQGGLETYAPTEPPFGLGSNGLDLTFPQLPSLPDLKPLLIGAAALGLVVLLLGGNLRR